MAQPTPAGRSRLATLEVLGGQPHEAIRVSSRLFGGETQTSLVAMMLTARDGRRALPVAEFDRLVPEFRSPNDSRADELAQVIEDVVFRISGSVSPPGDRS